VRDSRERHVPMVRWLAAQMGRNKCGQRVGESDGFKTSVGLGREAIPVDLIQQHRRREKSDSRHPAPQLEFPHTMPT
jgi:hypothetical protein